MPVIPATQEEAIGRTVVKDHPGRKVSNTPSQQSWTWWNTSLFTAIREA
jgi:hypothetical protein